MGPEVLGPLTGLVSVVLLFGAIPAVLIARSYFRSRERMQMQETIRAAIEKGQPLPSEMIDAISRDVRPVPSATRDLRVALVWLGVAAGLIGFAYALGYSADAGDAFWPLVGIACFPGFIGLAFLVMAMLNSGKGRN
jgi:hypothetical protein